MARLWLSLLGSVALIGAASAQDEEIIQLKGGEIVKGKVLKLDDKGILLQLSSNQEIFFNYEQINSYSAYDVRRKKMNKESADDHIAMADFCKRYGLLAYAIGHLKEAIQRAPERKDEIQKIQTEIRTEDAKQKVKAAKDIVEQKNEKKYDEAAKILHDIIEKYDDTPYYEEARKLEERLAEEVRRLRKERENQIEAAKKDQEAKQKDKESKEPVERTNSALEDGAKLWSEGLDQESQNGAQRAVAAWAAAEAKFLLAKANIDVALKKAKDPDLIARLVEQNKAADRWLVRTYLSLARIVAADSVDYVQAIRWINKALKLDPDNDKAYQLKLMITETTMRTRIESTRPR